MRGCAVTPYGSQGKTTDTVMVADASNHVAMNQQQWYVSISRGRKRVVVLTPDKTALRETIQCSGNRDLALDHGSANDTAQSIHALKRAVRIRKYIEIARRHQFHAQPIERTRSMGQRTTNAR